VIGVGWPRYRPRGLTPMSKRTIAYTRRRRKRSQRPVEKQARSMRPVNTEIVLFDHGPAEFPIAAVRPREPRARVVVALAALQRWLVARWQWFRPRTVPCAVAGLGMMAVLAFSDYLAHDSECTKGPVSTVHVQLAPR
jgi:hypothetical protein